MYINPIKNITDGNLPLIKFNGVGLLEDLIRSVHKGMTSKPSKTG